MSDARHNSQRAQARWSGPISGCATRETGACGGSPTPGRLPPSEQAPFTVLYLDARLEPSHLAAGLGEGTFGTWRQTQRSLARSDADELAEQNDCPVTVWVQGASRGRAHRQFVVFPLSSVELQPGEDGHKIARQIRAAREALDKQPGPKTRARRRARDAVRAA